jgi:DNA-directed RNA polymerase subunit RPC12/RpoP
MAAKEKVEVQDSVEATIIKDANRLACPTCGATRFHKGEYIELRTDGSESVAITEFRCIECNKVYQREELRELTSRV